MQLKIFRKMIGISVRKIHQFIVILNNLHNLIMHNLKRKKLYKMLKNVFLRENALNKTTKL